MAFPVIVEKNYTPTERVLHFSEEISRRSSLWLMRHADLSDEALKDLKPGMRTFVRWVLSLPGIDQVTVYPHRMIIIRAQLFSWSTLVPAIVAELPHAFNRGDIEVGYQTQSGRPVRLDDPAIEVLEAIFAASPGATD
jgi:hypothetical protein